jgi:TPP-dependent pyruvate/acetoin dehydrogenase alpha subunit
MDPEIMAKWKARDPIDILRRKIKDENKIKKIEERVNHELIEAVEFAKNSPQPTVAEFLASIPDY